MAVEVPRDRWGRPKIIPVGGGKPVPYTRVSTMAKTLDDTSALGRWFRRETIKGLHARPDLLVLAGTTLNDNRQLDALAEQAMEAAGSSKAANTGTALHTITEQVDAGEAVNVPPGYANDIAAYMTGYQSLGLSPTSAEQFVVVDELQTAGSFDRLWRRPDGSLVVGDLKTGKSVPDYPHNVAIQLALYANGLLYDPADGSRTPLPGELDRSVGLLVHMPAGQGVCRFYEMDLTVGWEWACTAASVRAWRKDKSFIKELTGRVLAHV